MATQHRVYQRPAGTAVPVGERVDRLELGVRDRGLAQRRQIGPADEPRQVVHQSGDVTVVRRNEGGGVRAVGIPTDPHLLLAPPAGDPRGVPGHESRVHGQDRALIKAVGQVQGGFHRGDIPDDRGGVALVGAAQLGERDGLRA